MMNLPIVVAGVFLLLLALFDVKKYEIPSVIGTTGIFFTAMILCFENPMFLLFGVLGFVFAWLLYELDYFSGIADIKAIVLLSLISFSITRFAFMMFFIGLFGLIYQISLKKALKLKHKKEIPFLPIFFMVWVVMMFIPF